MFKKKPLWQAFIVFTSAWIFYVNLTSAVLFGLGASIYDVAYCILLGIFFGLAEVISVFFSIYFFKVINKSFIKHKTLYSICVSSVSWAFICAPFFLPSNMRFKIIEVLLFLILAIICSIILKLVYKIIGIRVKDSI